MMTCLERQHNLLPRLSTACCQVEEKRAVSQDLELWISREAVEDGYNLVARAERIVQELHVTTKLSSADMKSVVQRVLQSLV